MEIVDYGNILIKKLW